MMKKEMPVKYWKNLPEAALIGGLVAGATERSGRMVDAAPTIAARRIEARTSGRTVPMALQLAGPAHALDLPDDSV